MQNVHEKVQNVHEMGEADLVTKYTNETTRYAWMEEHLMEEHLKKLRLHSTEKEGLVSLG